MLTKSAIACAIFAATSVSAFADTSATVGVMSQYFIHGYVQTQGATAYAHLDNTYGNASFGVWTTDVGDGLEVDVYGLYGVELDNGLSLSAGLTGYYYTSDFSETWEEFKLGASYGIVSLDYRDGTYDAVNGALDYTFIAVTVKKNGFYGKYGQHGDAFEGSYFEFGYGTQVAGFDVGVALISIDDDIASFDREAGDKGSETLTFSISKSFSL